MRVLAVDPGKVTGVAQLRLAGGNLTLVWSAECLEYEVGLHVRRALQDSSWEVDELVVVCETFRINLGTAKNSQAPWSLEVIGRLKQVCEDMGYPSEKIVMQAPADAKGFATNAKLRRLGLWHTGGAGHALDAIRHGLVYVVKTGWRSEKLIS